MSVDFDSVAFRKPIIELPVTITSPAPNNFNDSNNIECLLTWYKDRVYVPSGNFTAGTYSYGIEIKLKGRYANSPDTPPTVYVNGSTVTVTHSYSHFDYGVMDNVTIAAPTITFKAKGGSVTPTSATVGSDGKLTELP